MAVAKQSGRHPSADESFYSVGRHLWGYQAGLWIPAVPASGGSNKETEYAIKKALVGLGYRDFGIINGHADSEPAALRFLGVWYALDEAGVVLKPENLTRGNWQYRDGLAAARLLFSSADRL